LIAAAATAAVLGLAPPPATLATGDARATLADGVLTLETARIARTFLWNGGALVSRTVEDRAAGRIWRLDGEAPDVALPEGAAPSGGELTLKVIDAGPLRPAHLRVDVETRSGPLRIRRRCELFSGAPAIGCTVAFRGSANWRTAPAASDARMIERHGTDAGGPEFTVDRLALASPHWRLEAVRFRTATDHNDTLVQSDRSWLYRQPQRLSGNILRLTQAGGGAQLALFKEAPPGEDQLAYPGYDFEARTGDVRVAGSGVAAADVRTDAWTEAYPVVVAVAGPGERAFLEALRAHAETRRPYQPRRDAMLMSNTWGDRGRDSRIDEAFVLRELEAAARLGLTHVQLDDGWQAGLSRNSASAAGRLWEDWTADSWRPHPQRFPRGLEPVTRRARELGLELGLWFNPSSAGDYAAWRRDADIILDLHRRHGVRVFKIDGVEVPTKRAEVNLRAFFERVSEATGGAVVFNLDVTAGRRPGYHFMREYGNIFLENRYTDWGDYYPHRTLRSLWSLSRFVPPQFLQVEFLNPARNRDRYPADDPLAPGRMSPSYVFAATLAAQPLAWMEVANLPPALQAELAPLVRRYRALQPSLHAGRVFPIGAEPDGGSYTGFQSILPDGGSGYLILYREPLAAEPVGDVRTLLTPGVRTELTPVLGDAYALSATPGREGRVRLALPRPGRFAVWRYRQAP